MTYTRKLAIAGAALISWLAIPSVASASHCLPGQVYPADCVHGAEVSRDPLGQRPQVLGSEVASETAESESQSESSDTLPVTGGDLVGLTAMGLGALGVGSVFVRRSRRTT